ncbi:MAG: hypothetical protein ABI837_13760 [Acidobacteriota bacterium]
MKRMAFVAIATMFLTGSAPAPPYRGVAQEIGQGDFMFALGYDGHGENDALTIKSIDAGTGSFTGTFGRINAATRPVGGTIGWAGSSASRSYTITWALPSADAGPESRTMYSGAFLMQQSRTAFIAGTVVRAGDEGLLRGTAPFCGHGMPIPE